MSKKLIPKITSLLLFFLLISQFIIGVFAPVDISTTPPYIETKEASAANWYDANWSYRKQITIDRSKVVDVANPETTYLNFPIYIHTTGLSNINLNGTDIRFTSSDGITELPREIEKYDSGTLDAWVKLTLTKDNSDSTNDIIYMYYGNTNATEPLANSTYGSENVWDSSYKMVQHLQETDIDGGVGDIKDSTQYANNGTTEASMIGADQVAGQLDGSLDFDGGDDKIDIAYFSSLAFDNTDPITISAWINPDNIQGDEDGVGIIAQGTQIVLRFRTDIDSCEWILNSFSTNDRISSGASTIVTGSYNYVIGLYDGINLKIYINGVQKGSVIPTGTYGGDTSTFQIASMSGDYYFNGILDEVRVSNTARTPQWITTEYNNQSDVVNFLSFETAETLPEIQFTSTTSSNTEATTPITIEITLSETYSSNSTIDYTVTNGTATGSGTDYTLANGTATITAGNTTTTIPITIIEDNIDEADETIEITLSNPTNAILGTNTIHTYTIIDNDTAGIMINPTSGLTTTETGTTATYTAVLNTEPTAGVSFNITSSDETEGTVLPPSLTFTNANWDTPQTITITGIDDDIQDGNIAYTITNANATSSDSNYDNLVIDNVSVSNTDNDFASSGLPSSFQTPPTPPSPTPDNPTGGFQAVILQQTQDNNNQNITLKLTAGPNTKSMSISNNPDFKNADIIPYQEEIDISEISPTLFNKEGVPTSNLYIRFYTQYGVPSETIIIETETNNFPDNLNEGDIIMGPNKIKVYIINSHKYKRHIFNPDIFKMYHHLKWENIKQVSQEIINFFQISNLYKSPNDHKIYSLEEIDEAKGKAIKHHLNLTSEEFEKEYDCNEVFEVNREERDYYEEIE